MGKYKKLLLFVISILIICVGLIVLTSQTKKDQTVIHKRLQDESVINKEQTLKENSEERLYKNLQAFGKLYGYVRYFHPSDEGSELDWNRFAIYGVGKVKKAKNEEELKAILEKLFSPIAPSMSIFGVNENPYSNISNEKEGKFVAWQHYGLGNGEESLYKSERFSAYLENDTFTVEGLFDSFPKKNEVTVEKISDTLVGSIPVVLFYENESGTKGSNKTSLLNFQKLKESLTNLDPNLTSEDEDVRYAGIIVTWNVLNHFYPYFSEMKLDWEKELNNALKNTSKDQNRDEYRSSLLSLIEKTKDGQAYFSFTHYMENAVRFPFSMDIIENSVVITKTDGKSTLKPGDRILTLNEKDPMEIINQTSKEIPGSPQFKQFIALDSLHYLNTAKMQIKRGTEVLNMVVNSRENIIQEAPPREEPLTELEKGIYYLNTNVNTEKSLSENIEKLSKAKGIIIDIRNVHGTSLIQDTISHLIEKPVKGPIKRIMQTIYPNQKKPTFAEIRDAIPSKKPTIQGKVVILTNSGTISQLEYLLSYIKDNHLATIVGQATGGSTGNVQTYSIPGNLFGRFTGMEIVTANDRQIHLVGIEPDITVKRTMEAAMKGEDEYISKAIELINNHY
jgi:hypothetical protein